MKWEFLLKNSFHIFLCSCIYMFIRMFLHVRVCITFIWFFTIPFHCHSLIHMMLSFGFIHYICFSIPHLLTALVCMAAYVIKYVLQEYSIIIFCFISFWNLILYSPLSLLSLIRFGILPHFPIFCCDLQFKYSHERQFNFNVSITYQLSSFVGLLLSILFFLSFL